MLDKPPEAANDNIPAPDGVEVVTGRDDWSSTAALGSMQAPTGQATFDSRRYYRAAVTGRCTPGNEVKGAKKPV
ncbi:hypothetical protein MXD81_61200 [Microbacteriaceae bacterium K1510]|nr:hypothetical protein [Microbacteriaceae bacterium K1510]